MRRAHYGVEVPSESKTVGKLMEYVMEADSLEEAYTTSMKENPIFMEEHFLPWKLKKPSTEVPGVSHVIWYLLPWK